MCPFCFTPASSVLCVSFSDSMVRHYQEGVKKTRTESKKTLNSEGKRKESESKRENVPVASLRREVKMYPR